MVLIKARLQSLLVHLSPKYLLKIAFFQIYFKEAIAFIVKHF